MTFIISGQSTPMLKAMVATTSLGFPPGCMKDVNIFLHISSEHALVYMSITQKL